MKKKERNEALNDFITGNANVFLTTNAGEESIDYFAEVAIFYDQAFGTPLRGVQRAGRVARIEDGEVIHFIMYYDDKKSKINISLDKLYYFIEKKRTEKVKAMFQARKEYGPQNKLFDYHYPIIERMVKRKLEEKKNGFIELPFDD